MLKKYKFLLLILLLAASLRFYKLGSVPAGLDWDETAHGYNAYSILKTGRDEYGYRLPLSFRSFDDYKPPLYTYLVVPSVALFGLNDFAVRFPSAVLGTFAVLFTYLMVYELFKGKSKDQEKRAKKIATLAALFLAISPWHLQFSRVAFETNSAIFWSVLGTWAFLKGINFQGKKLAIWLSVCAFAFGANLFMYHNARVFIPFFSLVLLFLYWKKLQKNLKFLIAPAIVSVVFIVTLIPIIFSISGQLRYQGTTIFGDQSPKFIAAQLQQEDTQAGQSNVGKFLHNRRLVYVPILIDNYLSNFKLNYLFFNADMNRHHAPEIGLLYLWDLPFILMGMYFLANKDFSKKTKVIIFWWFLAAPLAATVTWGLPHSLRTEIYLPTYQIFAAIGSYYAILHLSKNKLIPIAVFGLLAINFLIYLHQYYGHMDLEYSQDWFYGRKEAALFSQSQKQNYDRVIVSTKLEQPHEFWLYYLKYDPAKYQQEGGTVSGGFLEQRNKFDKYQFKQIDFEKQRHEQKTLFVGLPGEFPNVHNPIKVINYLNGEPAIWIVDTNSS